MRVIQLSFLLCVCLDNILGSEFGFTTSTSFRLTPSNRQLSERPSRYLSFQAPPSISNLCDKSKVDSDAEDAHTTCDRECFVMRDTVRSIYQEYGSYSAVESLYEKCGMVSRGTCRYWRRISTNPSCFCYTGHDKRSFLTVCRLGIPWARKLANFGIGMKQPVNIIQHNGERLASACGDRFRPGSAADGSKSVLRYISRLMRSKTAGNASIEEDEPETNEEEEEEEENELEREDWGSPDTDNDPEGYVLVADLHISGRIVRALVDTGASNTLIDQSLTDVKEPLNSSRPVFGVDGELLPLTGTATVIIRTERGFDFPVSGYVMENARFGITLGTDFFLKYAAKIKVSDRSMILKMNRSKVKIALKWREAPKPKPISMEAPSDSSAEHGKVPANIEAEDGKVGVVGMYENTDSPRLKHPRSRRRGSAPPPPPTRPPTHPAAPFTAKPSIASTHVLMYAFINGKRTGICVDTGAETSVIKHALVDDNEIHSADVPNYLTAGGTTLNFVGETDIEFGVENMWIKTKAMVADLLHDYLLGNNLNKHHIHLIDFKRRIIIFKCPESGEQVKARIYVTKLELLFNP